MIIRCVIFIGIVLALIVYKPAVFNSKVAQQSYWIWKTHRSQKFDMVLVGDSRVQHGIAPQILEQDLQKRVLNFGYSAACINADFLTKAASKLDPDGSKLVFIGVSHLSLSEKNYDNPMYYQYENKTWMDRVEYQYLGSFLSYFDPVQPIEFYYAAFGIKKGEYEYYGYNGWKYSEFYPKHKESLMGYQQKFAEQQVSEKVIEELMETVKVLTNQGFTIVGCRIPAITEMWALEDNLSTLDLDDFALAFESNGGKWIEATTEGYQTIDGSHLTRESALLFSKLLADSVIVMLPHHNFD